MEIDREHRSPNFKARTQKPTLIVLHASAGKSDAGDLDWICRKESGVSYHYLVGRDGTVYELVDPAKHQAWHAGVSEWKGVKHCNGYSIGASWANRHDGEPLTGAQLKAMRELLDHLAAKHPTVVEVVTHKDVAPGRKSDPELVPNFHKPDWCGPLRP